MPTEHRPFPLLAGQPGPYQAGPLSYPRLYTFADGSSAPLFSRGILAASELEAIAQATAGIIAARCQGQRLLLIHILEGGRTFAGLLHDALRQRQADHDLRYEVAALKVRSYSQGSQSRGHKVLRPLTDCQGREMTDCSPYDGVVLIDDLIDCGQTMAWLISEYLPRLAAKSLGVCTMLEKDRGREAAVEAILGGCLISAGRLVPDEWLVGYGLDMALAGSGKQAGAHLFRQALPGGIYAFNSAIEQRLQAEYQADPGRVTGQLQVYVTAE